MCLKNRNAKSFIPNKINIIAKAPVRYSYSSFSRAKLIHNILEKLIHNTFSFLQILFALLHTPLAESKVHSNSYFLVPQINLITLFYPVRLMVWLKWTPMLEIVLSFFGTQKNLSIFYNPYIILPLSPHCLTEISSYVSDFSVFFFRSRRMSEWRYAQLSSKRYV